jgi:hypothetical protein
MTLKKDEGSIILYDQLAKQFTNIKIVLYHKNKKLLKQLFERISRKELLSKKRSRKELFSHIPRSFLSFVIMLTN